MPSIGNDLLKIRKHLGYTIEDIQYATKIPVHTLRTVEDDSILSKSEEGSTYIRSFIRSYGRALNIDDDLVIKALDQQDTGNYNELLLEPFPALSNKDVSDTNQESIEPKTDAPSPDDQSTESAGTPPIKAKPTQKNKELFDDDIASETLPDKDIDTGSDEKETDIPSVKPSEPQAETADSPPVANNGEKSVSNVNWADLGQKIDTKKNQTPLWIVGIIILILILAVAGYFLYQNDFLVSDDDAQEEITTPSAQSTPDSYSLGLDDPEPQPLENTIQGTDSTLDDILFITVYAAFDNVSPVRVWSDLKPRLDPYWLNQGTAMNFEFRDSVQIRGPYDNMILFMNGHRIDNAIETNFNEEENVIELTRNYFTADEKWTNTIDLELPETATPPDTVINRPSF